MSLTYTRLDQKNVINKFYGVVTMEDLNQSMDCFFHAYKETGDALGLILDCTELECLTFGSMLAAQSNVYLLRMNIPVAVVVKKSNSVVVNFLKMLDSLVGLPGRRVSFFESKEEGLAYLEQWFTNKNRKRNQLYGVHSVDVSKHLQ